MKENKKGQLDGLTGNILALTVAIIVLVMGIVIVQEIRDADIIDSAISLSAVNETLTTVDETGDSVSLSTSPGFKGFNVDIVTNATSGDVIGSGNFTTTDSGTITAVDGSEFNSSNWNVTYSGKAGDESFVAGNASLVGLGDFSDFVPIIVIAVAASIIIGLILLGFAFNRRTR